MGKPPIVERWTATHLANAFNSTEFTDCCGLAVLREDKSCPGCRATVSHRTIQPSRNCRMCGQPRSVCYC